MKQENKKTWAVVGVPFGKSLERHAVQLEKALNDLTNVGYSVQMNQTARGIIVIGRLLEEQAVPRIQAFAIPFPTPDLEKIRHFDLVKPLFDAMVDSGSDQRLNEVADGLIKRTSLEVVREIIGGLEAEAADHDKHHEDAECDAPEHLRKAAKVLKERLGLQVS